MTSHRRSIGLSSHGNSEARSTFNSLMCYSMVVVGSVPSSICIPLRFSACSGLAMTLSLIHQCSCLGAALLEMLWPSHRAITAQILSNSTNSWDFSCCQHDLWGQNVQLLLHKFQVPWEEIIRVLTLLLSGTNSAWAVPTSADEEEPRRRHKD